MLRLLGRWRWRRDELTPYEAQIVREQRLSIPGEAVPVRRRSAVLRHKTAIITAAAVVAGCGLGGGGVYAASWWEERQEAAQAEAEYWQASAEFWALSEAYQVVREDEMRERGFSREKIREAGAAAYAQFLTGEQRGPDLPEPRDPATLEIQDQLDAAKERKAALRELMSPDS